MVAGRHRINPVALAGASAIQLLWRQLFRPTLAALARRPLAIGAGYPAGALASIFAQPHDIRMDMIVTTAIVDHRSSPQEAGREPR